MLNIPYKGFEIFRLDKDIICVLLSQAYLIQKGLIITMKSTINQTWQGFYFYFWGTGLLMG